jgi:hypothetical protein
MSITSARRALRGERVDGAEGFVHQQELGVHREGAPHADALLHPAGELARVGVLETEQPHDAHHLCHALGKLLGREAQGLEHHLDVSRDRHPGVEREALEDERDPRVPPLERDAVLEHLPLHRGDEPGEDPQQRRLAAARWAEQRHHLPGSHDEVDLLEHRKPLAAGRGEGERDAARLAERGRGLRIDLRCGHPSGPLPASDHFASEKRSSARR